MGVPPAFASTLLPPGLPWWSRLAIAVLRQAARDAGNPHLAEPIRRGAAAFLQPEHDGLRFWAACLELDPAAIAAHAAHLARRIQSAPDPISPPAAQSPPPAPGPLAVPKSAGPAAR